MCPPQALHWFDLPVFYSEAHRILRPGGVLASWGMPACTHAHTRTHTHTLFLLRVYECRVRHMHPGRGGA